MSVCRKRWAVLGKVADQQRYDDNQKKPCVHLNNAELWLHVRRGLCQADHLGRGSQGTDGNLLARKNPRKHHQLCTTQVINIPLIMKSQAVLFSYSLARIGTEMWSRFVFDFTRYFLVADHMYPNWIWAGELLSPVLLPRAVAWLWKSLITVHGTEAADRFWPIFYTFFLLQLFRFGHKSWRFAVHLVPSLLHYSPHALALVY